MRIDDSELYLLILRASNVAIVAAGIRWRDISTPEFPR